MWTSWQAGSLGQSKQVFGLADKTGLISVDSTQTEHKTDLSSAQYCRAVQVVYER